MILALKTSDAVTQIWLQTNPNTDFELSLEWESGRTLSEDLLGRIMTVLSEAGAAPADLSGIVIFSGPGSFTSLRIGHAVANALAYSSQIPIIGTGGEDWLTEGIKQLEDRQLSAIAVPNYGGEAHITRPKP